MYATIAAAQEHRPVAPAPGVEWLLICVPIRRRGEPSYTWRTGEEARREYGLFQIVDRLVA